MVRTILVPVCITLSFALIECRTPQVGCVEGGCRDGVGAYRFPTGDVYRGGFRNGQPHGTGRYEYTDGTTYEGQFFEGVREGRGMFRYANGDVYVGEWKNDKAHG